MAWEAVSFMRLTLVVVCPSASLAVLVSLSSFNHSSWLKYNPQSFRAKALVCSTLNPWVPDFRVFGFLKDKNGQEVFLRFCWHTKKIWRERKLTCDKNNQIENCLYACLFCSNEISYHRFHYMWQLVVNFSYRWQDLSVCRKGLMRVKKFFLYF